MNWSNAGRVALASAFCAGGLWGCASKPEPLPATQIGQAEVSPDVYAIAGTDTLTRQGFERACQQTRVLPHGDNPRTLDFWNEYVRYSLESRYAQETGITRDSARQRRWASIRERILADRYENLVLHDQYGRTDSSVNSVIASDLALQRLPEDSAHWVVARRQELAGVNLDSVYKANQETFRRKDSTFTPYDSVRAQVEDLYLGTRLQNLMGGEEGRLRVRYNVQIPDVISQDSVKAYYQRNLDQWMPQPVYRLCALSSRNAASLKSALARRNPASKEAFQALAKQFPVGTPAAPNGDLGRVKRGYAIPYGVGMIADLFTALDSAKPGRMVGPITNDSVSYVFWYESVDRGTPRPYDSVKADVKDQYVQEHSWAPSSSTVVATWDRGVLFTRDDVDFIMEEIPMRMRREFPSNRVLSFMIHWKLYARAAADGGLLARRSVRAALHDDENAYWSQAWRQTRDASAFLQSDSVLNAAWKRWQPKLFPSGKAEDVRDSVNRDAARLALMPEGYLQEQYELRGEAWSKDSVMPSFDSLAPRIFRGMRNELGRIGQDHIDSVLKARYGYRQFAAAPHAHEFSSLREIYDSARAAYDARRIDRAELLYKRIENDYGNGDTLYDKAIFQLGQLEGEKQDYPASLAAYRTLLKKRPQSPEAYKARFMIAFTFSEYLKQENRALVEYRRVLADYPDCELAKDADWMIRNIESGGALMPKFEDSAAPDDAKTATPAAGKTEGGKSQR